MKLISTNYVDVLKSCVTAVIVVTEEGNIVMANRKACRMFSYRCTDLLKLPVTAIFEELQALYECGFDEKHTGTGELCGIKKSGRKIALKFFCVPYKSENGASLTVLSLVNFSEAGDLPVLMSSFCAKVAGLQEIAKAVLGARELERREIGRELHDNVNQILASAVLYLGLQRKASAGVQPYLEESDMLIKKAISEIRALSHSLIAPSLAQDEFMKALEEIIATSCAGTSLSIDKEVTGFEEKKVSEALWLTVFRIIQEHFSNIIKYAAADKVHLKLSHEKQAVLLSIRDNGVGFDPSKAGRGVGLTNINSRASSNNGHARIYSSPGNGCELKVHFRLG